MKFQNFVKNIQNNQIHIKPLDELIYFCENDDFEKYGNVLNICFVPLTYVKSIFLSHA